MLKVGLTGGLACGKSFVGQALRDLGCHLIEADKLGHDALRPGGAAYADVVQEFGPSIQAEDGSIDRKRLAAEVFGRPDRLAKLNRLVHPHVFRMEEKLIEEFVRTDPHGITVVEAAILIEAGSYKNYDRLILVECDEKQQIERALKRDHAEREEVLARLSRQMPVAEKRKFADYVIDTSGSKEDTLRQTREVYESLRRIPA
ncbi:MAG TPA: dephospho-CoA kinase [Bryobacteraceae bacterium]|nr:dephospho-CoA kinase [Bryobacteraceae bacterium]